MLQCLDRAQQNSIKLYTYNLCVYKVYQYIRTHVAQEYMYIYILCIYKYISKYLHPPLWGFSSVLFRVWSKGWPEKINSNNPSGFKEAACQQQKLHGLTYGCFLKWWYPRWVFLQKNDHFGVLAIFVSANFWSWEFRANLKVESLENGEQFDEFAATTTRF